MPFLAAVGAFFNGVGKWLSDNPVIAKALLIVAGIWAAWWGKERWEENVKKGVQRIEREAAKRQMEAQINSQTQEAHERVEAFNEAARTVERMPAGELLKSTETDPLNRGRVSRN